jgi:hypothetical protein
MKKNSTSIATVVLGFVALSFVGCDGQTTKSLCDQPTGPIEGITGIYEFNSRDPETFGIKTDTIKITPDEKKLTYKVSGLSKGDDIVICNVAGHVVMEAQEDDNTYSQVRVFISNVGLQFSPILYDKVALDAAGVPNKVVVLRSQWRGLLGESLAGKVDKMLGSLMSVLDVEESKYILVDNANLPNNSLLMMSKPASYGLTLFRR